MKNEIKAGDWTVKVLGEDDNGNLSIMTKWVDGNEASTEFHVIERNLPVDWDDEPEKPKMKPTVLKEEAFTSDQHALIATVLWILIIISTIFEDN